MGAYEERLLLLRMAVAARKGCVRRMCTRFAWPLWFARPHLQRGTPRRQHTCGTRVRVRSPLGAQLSVRVLHSLRLRANQGATVRTARLGVPSTQIAAQLSESQGGGRHARSFMPAPSYPRVPVRFQPDCGIQSPHCGCVPRSRVAPCRGHCGGVGGFLAAL